MRWRTSACATSTSRPRPSGCGGPSAPPPARIVSFCRERVEQKGPELRRLTTRCCRCAGGSPMDTGLLLIRIVVGLLLVGHGTQKLFGWFGGHGLEGTGGFFEKLGYRPGKVWAAVAGMSETGGGLLLALGLFTPLASAMIIGV